MAYKTKGSGRSYSMVDEGGSLGIGNDWICSCKNITHAILMLFSSPRVHSELAKEQPCEIVSLLMIEKTTKSFIFFPNPQSQINKYTCYK
jgi:hypothetical protein